MKSPKLRSVEKYKPPFAPNKFPSDFALGLGREVVYLLATRGYASLEGGDWEQIFARLVGARWKPSNVGLDDIVLEQTAWGAKTVKATNPAHTRKVRLISGRNSPVYSFGDSAVSDCDPNELGEKVLSIWNERVTAVRKLYRHIRTVVLLKADDLLEMAVFEFETTIFPEEEFVWKWNTRKNLEGHYRKTGEHKFTWQPHGSQFTIIEEVPRERLAIRIKQPPILKQENVFTSLGFDATWVEVIK